MDSLTKDAAMRRRVVLSILVAGSLLLMEGTSMALDVRWRRRVDGPFHGEDGGSQVAVGPEGTIHVVGSVEVAPGRYAAWVAAYDPGGNRLWRTVSRGPEGQSVAATAIALGPGGLVHVAGVLERNRRRLDTDIWIRTYLPGGEAFWTRTFNCPASRTSPSWDAAYDAAVDGDGNLYVAGMAGGAVWLGKYDPAGRRLWHRRKDSRRPDLDYAAGVALAPDGTIHTAATLRALEMSRPSRLWLGVWSPGGELIRFSEDGLDHAGGGRVSVDDQGRDWTLGFLATADRGEVWRMALFGAGGALLAEDLLNGESEGHDLVPLPGGGALAAGDIMAEIDGEPSRDLLLRRYLPDGAPGWSETWSTGRKYASESARGVALGGVGDLVVVGTLELVSPTRDESDIIILDVADPGAPP